MAKLSKSKLLALISQEIQSSLGFYSSDLSKQRENALKYYLGEPLGNEVEGRSSVVSQDILEVIESILPSLMRMFTQSDKMVNFEPQQAEDVKYAEQMIQKNIRVNNEFYVCPVFNEAIKDKKRIIIDSKR